MQKVTPSKISWIKKSVSCIILIVCHWSISFGCHVWLLWFACSRELLNCLVFWCFGCERAWRQLQKHVMHTKLYIYNFVIVKKVFTILINFLCEIVKIYYIAIHVPIHSVSVTNKYGGHRGPDRIVVGFTTTYAISAYHH